MIKKIVFLIGLFFINSIYVGAESINVTLNKCVDGDTAKFIYNEEVITARFLAIDTPETVAPNKPVEPWGKEASDYTCSLLGSAKTIILEYDNNSDKEDKYDRHLVWVFVDGKLLQKDLIQKGLAKVAYIYGEYMYTDELLKEESIAEAYHIGLWGEEKVANENTDNSNDTNSFYIIGTGILVILMFIFNKKYRKKVIRQSKRLLKNSLK